MRNIFVPILAIGAILVLIAATDYPGPVGNSGSTLVGGAVEFAPACVASSNDLQAKDIKLLDRWIELLAKKRGGDITGAEDDEGFLLWRTGTCLELRPDVEATLIVVDGVNSLVDLCVPEGCARVIMKTDDVILND